MDEAFLIVRLTSLGDIVHTLPAFAALRKHRPGAHLAWVAEKAGREILELVEGLDEIIIRGEPGWLGRLRRRDRTAIDFQGLLKSGLLARLSGARRRVGFSGKNLKERSASLFYNLRLPEFREEGHVIAKNLRLLGLLGIEENRFVFPIRIPEGLRAEARAGLSGLGWREDRPLVLCNVGAAWATKRWPASGWAEILPILKGAGAFPLLLWGNENERRIAEAAASETGIPLSPFLAVKEVMAWIREARLLLSGDTFALQAACALGVPVVGLFGPTSPERNGPFDSRDKVVYAHPDCAPCYRRTCDRPDCLTAIAPRAVAAAAMELLNPHA
jgi:heptosyltransferase-1